MPVTTTTASVVGKLYCATGRQCFADFVWIDPMGQAASANPAVGIGVTAPTGLLSLGASTASEASLNIAAGTAPTGGNLHNGDLWYVPDICISRTRRPGYLGRRICQPDDQSR